MIYFSIEFIKFFVCLFIDAPSLEGLTRHLSGGKLQPGLLFFITLFLSTYILQLKEKLFDIARRVPFLAMTIVEKNSQDSPWLFRTQPLQTGATPSMRELPLELAAPPTPTPVVLPQQKPKQQQQQAPPPPPPPPMSIQMNPMQSEQEQQRLQQTQNLRSRVPTGPMPIDPKKVAKSSTAPNLPTSNSLSEMFRVI